MPDALEGLQELHDLTVVRWREQGRDRLLVNGPDGERLGQLDLHTGQQRIVVQEARRAVEDAIGDWLQTHPGVRVRGTRIRPVAVRGTVVPAGPSAGSTAALDVAGRATPGSPLRRAVPTGPLAGVARALLAGGRTISRRDGRVRVTVSVPGSPSERRLVHRLERLGPSWRVLPAVHVGSQDDAVVQLVVGPGGVYCLRTFERPHATIWVAGDVLVADGRRRDDVQRVRALAEQAARRLGVVTGSPVAVVGLVVPVGADRLSVRRPPVGVAVVGTREVHQWLRAQPPQLDRARVEALVEAAADPATW